MLEQEFILCVEQAEKENSISLVCKANTLKRKSNENKEDIGGSIVTPGGEEEETKSMIIDFESLCYVDVFYIILWKIYMFLLLFVLSFI